MADATQPAQPAKPAPAATPKALPGEVVFEVWDQTIPDPQNPKKPFKRARCRDVIFPPAKQKLRGRWERGMLTPTEASSEGLETLPEAIPGMHVVINVAKHTVKFVDPLSYDENKSLLEDLQDIGRRRENVKWMPERMVEHQNQSPNQMKTALWWAVRMVQAKSLVVVKGQCPTIKEVEALPGKIRYELFNNSANSNKFREDLPRDDWDEAAGAVLGAAAPAE